MKYEPELIKRICDELVKMPSIRHVCSKIGIDHSTFYRWQSKHPTFYKLTLVALVMGRDRMCEAAESVVVRGIQENNFKAATYWLSHNHPRYASQMQHNKLYDINENHIDILSGKDTPITAIPEFETMYSLCLKYEKFYTGKGEAREHIEKLVKERCLGDQALEQIFYVTYEDWKKGNP